MDPQSKHWKYIQHIYTRPDRRKEQFYPLMYSVTVVNPTQQWLVANLFAAAH